MKDDIHSTAQLRERIKVAMGSVRSGDSGSARHLPLTDTQMDLLRMVAEGLTNAEIAKRRVVSERAVETALSRTLRRLGVTPRDSENPRALLIREYYQLIGGTGAR